MASREHGWEALIIESEFGDNVARASGSIWEEV
jgi:hypothetical protein